MIETDRPQFSILTEADMAAHYDSISGVPGWTAKLMEGSRFELTPPPGYIIARGEDGSERLVKAPPAGMYGVRIGKTDE